MTSSPRQDPTAEEHGSDADLIARAREGDEGAFRNLVERYEGAVAATVIGMMGPGGDADDVGQDVFIAFYRNLRKFRGDASLKTYLTRIAINTSLNALKKRRRLLDRFVSRDRGEDEAPLPEPAASGHDQLVQTEISAVVHRAIRNLRPEHRSVVVLRMIDGYSTREAAEILGLPQGTIMSRLSRAMKALKAQLGPHMELIDD